MLLFNYSFEESLQFVCWLYCVFYFLFSLCLFPFFNCHPILSLISFSWFFSRLENEKRFDDSKTNNKYIQFPFIEPFKTVCNVPILTFFFVFFFFVFSFLSTQLFYQVNRQSEWRKVILIFIQLPFDSFWIFTKRGKYLVGFLKPFSHYCHQSKVSFQTNWFDYEGETIENSFNKMCRLDGFSTSLIPWTFSLPIFPNLFLHFFSFFNFH